MAAIPKFCGIPVYHLNSNSLSGDFGAKTFLQRKCKCCGLGAKAYFYKGECHVGGFGAKMILHRKSQFCHFCAKNAFYKGNCHFSGFWENRKIDQIPKYFVIPVS